MRYLLDTNAVISLLTKRSPTLVRRILECAEGEIGLPSIVAHELYFGAYKSAKAAFNLETLRILFSDFPIMPFEQEDARVAGQIRAILSAGGTPIGPFDVLIAGQASARKLILITNNFGEFTRVPDLELQDWTQP